MSEVQQSERQREWEPRILGAIRDYAHGCGECAGQHPLIALRDELADLITKGKEGNKAKLQAAVLALEHLISSTPPQEIPGNDYWRALVHIARDFCQDKSGKHLDHCNKLANAFCDKLLNSDNEGTTTQAYLLAGLVASGGKLDFERLNALEAVKYDRPLIWLMSAFHLGFHEQMLRQLEESIEKNGNNLPAGRLALAFYDWHDGLRDDEQRKRLMGIAQGIRDGKIGKFDEKSKELFKNFAMENGEESKRAHGASAVCVGERERVSDASKTGTDEGCESGKHIAYDKIQCFIKGLHVNDIADKTVSTLQGTPFQEVPHVNRAM